ncbi:hypothetical protein G3A_14000 [Bacillus sp. 17376]|uniref:PTS cellobiose transporter subunit IIA n=1 Tax=Mesobacillus boroniphilus JCM 21738 TaxID=1294265 RepID=W4RN96_9BACI|nr:hypothetical protein [Mesobacillus boroniphilus]ESU31923.1 hypothetical protein G3A_14000 [Bacillus sp. 17376]GAE45786.1 hypothetical protein JCM21738_2630 [Mesobacillus boroniphilus JCM 21738]
MVHNERAQVEKHRKEMSLKSMYFNRYLLVRYVTALFFFTNVYWLISLLMSDSSLYFIPLALLIILLFGTAEQVKLYSHHVSNTKYTRYSFIAMLVAGGILILMTFFSSSFAQLYPFLVAQEQSKIVVLSVLLLGVLLNLLVLYRLNQIRHNEDKHYERIKKYEEVIN